jgi:uncharacterized protein
MEAFRSTPGKVCMRPIIRSAFPSLSIKPTPRRDAMTNAGNHHKINYIEFASTDIDHTKKFYSAVFGWSFQDYGPDYIAFSAAEAAIDGGFYRSVAHDATPKTAPLVVIYSSDLKASEDAVIAAGGSIVVPTFQFPGGRRFHFADGAGNVLAVWSE